MPRAVLNDSVIYRQAAFIVMLLFRCAATVFVRVPNIASSIIDGKGRDAFEASQSCWIQLCCGMGFLVNRDLTVVCHNF